ncbi:MAG: PAS domain-containing hybrid sensor histidine kinase/response regulator [Candidatus Anammoxibacter sp.]
MIHRDAMDTNGDKKDDFTLLDSSPIGQFVINKEFKVLFWNKCIENWTGINREQIVNTDLLQQYPHLKSATYINRIRMVFENAMPAVFSSLIHDHFIPFAVYGEVLRTQHVTATCIYGKARDERYVLVSMQDTSNLMGSIAKLNIEMEIRKKTEESAKKSDRRYARMLQVSEDAIVSIDERRNIFIFNKAAERIFGYTAAEIIGKSIETLIPDRYRTGHKEKVEEFGKSETDAARLNDRQYELFGLKKNGDEFPVDISISKFNDDGNMIYTAVLRDITQQKQSEKKVKHLASFPQMCINPIIEIDPSGNIIFFNKAASKFLKKVGLDKELSLFLPKDIDDIIKTLNNKNEIQLYREVEIKGFTFAENIHLTPTLNVIRIYTHDLTERKKVEKEAFKLQKLESVGTLAGGIAHDFNNILTAILGNTNLATTLTKAGNTDKVLESLSSIERASLRARDLTGQLLTFSKGGSPVKKTVSLVGLIKESSGFAVTGSNVECVFSVPEDLWPVNVDAGQMNQVINNIVLNAVQAMPQGGNIKINAENVAERDGERTPLAKNCNQIKISIIDQGSGIKEEHLANIFDPYFTTKQTGSGLGLATSYSIIKQHGGVITAKSEPGAGSIFYIYLPVSEKNVEKENAVADKPLVGSGKVLVMDDDDAIRDMCSQLLDFIGYEVECAEDGDKTLDMYKKAMESGKPFDVVIMDLTIPGGMGGKETIEKLLGIDTEVKVIVSSGYSGSPIMSDYKKLGFKGVIGKPFEIKDMNALLQQVIKG